MSGLNPPKRKWFYIDGIIELRPMTIYTLKDLVRDLKMDALYYGRYHPPYDDRLWEKREKSKAFRCIAYNECVRRINAIEEVISELEKNI